MLELIKSVFWIVIVDGVYTFGKANGSVFQYFIQYLKFSSLQEAVSRRPVAIFHRPPVNCTASWTTHTHTPELTISSPPFLFVFELLLFFSRLLVGWKRVPGCYFAVEREGQRQGAAGFVWWCLGANESPGRRARDRGPLGSCGGAWEPMQALLTSTLPPFAASIVE